VRIENILRTVLREAHERRVEQAMKSFARAGRFEWIPLLISYTRS
jgi:hypothetical protein